MQNAQCQHAILSVNIIYIIKGGTNMAYNQKRNKQNQIYQNAVYDRLAIRVKKGKREEYKALADRRGVSLAGLITGLLDAELEREQDTANQ